MLPSSACLKCDFDLHFAICPDIPREEDTIKAQYAGLERLEETPHGCYEGWVYMGFENEDESGERVEVVERVRCRHEALR